MAEIIKLGCLQFNRQPVAPGAKHNGENISFGDTIQELAIPFVKWKNLLLATQCVCTNISWEDLNHPGFIFGYPIKIDGTPYTCRSFQVGKTESASSELYRWVGICILTHLLCCFQHRFFCDTVAQEGCPNTIDWCGSSGCMGMEHSKNFPPRFSYPPKEESSSIWSHKQKKDNLPNIGKVVFSFQVDTTANSHWRASCVV